MRLNLFGFCGEVSGNTVFVINQVLDAVVLLCVAGCVYTRKDPSSLVSDKYGRHVRRIFIFSIVLFAVAMFVNLATFLQRRVSRFGNNVAFLSAKIALYVFVLSAIVLDYTYNDAEHRLVSAGAYAAIIVADIILLYLSALGLKACNENTKSDGMSTPETAMANEIA